MLGNESLRKLNIVVLLVNSCYVMNVDRCIDTSQIIESNIEFDDSKTQSCPRNKYYAMFIQIYQHFIIATLVTDQFVTNAGTLKMNMWGMNVKSLMISSEHKQLNKERIGLGLRQAFKISNQRLIISQQISLSWKSNEITGKKNYMGSSMISLDT